MNTPDTAGSGELVTPSFCVLFVCFAGASAASKARRTVNGLLRQGEDVVLDEVILRVGSDRRARVHDPRRTRAGLLTAALTWGVFGLLTGGWASLGVWAIFGGVCGGAWAFVSEHLLTSNQLSRIGRSMPADSSAVAVFLQSDQPQELLSRVSSSVGPTTASVAVISDDMTIEVHAEADGSEMPDVPLNPGQGALGGTQPVQADRLAMILARYRGVKGAAHLSQRQSVPDREAKTSSSGHAPQVELLIETDVDGRHRVIDPTTGARAVARGDVVSWGAFGLVWGAVVGFVGASGLLGSFERSVLTGFGYAAFGLVAGALYGLWAGRGVSARQVGRLGPLLPTDTDTVVAWADDTVSAAEITQWSAGSEDHLTLWFTPTTGGARLAA